MIASIGIILETAVCIPYIHRIDWCDKVTNKERITGRSSSIGILIAR